MSLFPYDPLFLRCHAMWMSICWVKETETTLVDLHSKSHRRIHVCCSVCGATFDGKIDSLTRQSMLCKQHSASLRNHFRSRYNGEIPKAILDAVRAGLLRGINKEDSQFIQFIDTLAREHDCPLSSMEIINEVARYNNVQLRDNTFWVQPKKRKPKNVHNGM